MNVQYHIININLTAVSTDEPIEVVPCGSCNLCCKKLSPYLTPDEIASGLYPISLIQPEILELSDNPNIGPKVALYRNPDGGCGMLKNEQCSIYDIRPLACRQFDCRKQHHPSIPDMTVNNN